MAKKTNTGKLSLVKKSDILLIKVHSTDYDAVSECNFAVMKLTPEIRKQIRGMKSVIDIVRNNTDKGGYSDLYKMTYWSPEWGADFLGDSAMGQGSGKEGDKFYDNAFAKIQNNSILHLNNVPDSSNDDLRLEAHQLHIYEDGIRFDCIVKHTDVKLETERISFEQLGI